jgi:hypothetical protein
VVPIAASIAIVIVIVTSIVTAIVAAIVTAIVAVLVQGIIPNKDLDVRFGSGDKQDFPASVSSAVTVRVVLLVVSMQSIW